MINCVTERTLFLKLANISNREGSGKMKTIQELCKEIESSEAMKNELMEIKDKDSFEAF